MDAIYYIAGTLMTLSLIALVVMIIVYLIKPSYINKSKFVKKPLSRPKIVGIGLAVMVVGLMGFGSVLAATEPASVKEARIAQEAATQKTEQQKKDAIEQDRLRKIEAAKPKVKVETKTELVAFESTEQNDATIPLGEKRVQTEGANGVRTITYDVTYTNGVETARRETKNEVTTQPITKLTLVGTYVAPVVSAPIVPQSSSSVRIGATCNDGSHSNATGSGACSHHGGVAVWLYS
jgi:hypothetical protein